MYYYYHCFSFSFFYYHNYYSLHSLSFSPFRLYKVSDHRFHDLFTCSLIRIYMYPPSFYVTFPVFSRMIYSVYNSQYLNAFLYILISDMAPQATSHYTLKTFISEPTFFKYLFLRNSIFYIRTLKLKGPWLYITSAVSRTVC